MSETKLCLSTAIAFLSVGSNDGETVFFFSAEKTSGSAIRPYGSLEPESRVVSKVPAAQDGAAMVCGAD